MSSRGCAPISARCRADIRVTGGAAARRKKIRFAERLFRGRFALNEPVQWFCESLLPQGQGALRTRLRPFDPTKNHGGTQ